MSKESRSLRVKNLFLKDYIFLYIMLLPAIVYYIIFSYFPMYGLILSLKDYRPFNGIWGSKWVGLKHFEAMFADKLMWTAFRNTVAISLYKLVICFPLPIILTLFINEIRSRKYKRIVQTAIYFPRFLSWVIVAAIFSSFLSPQKGIVNSVLLELGLLKEPVYFLGSNSTIRGVYVFTEVWKSAGWGTVIYLAAITGINPEIYESAFLDGAGRFQRMRYITLPGIMATISVMFILQIGSLMNANFDQVISFYNDLVRDKGDILDTFVYRRGIINGQVGYSTAAGLLKSVINTFLLVGADRFSKRLGQDGFL